MLCSARRLVARDVIRSTNISRHFSASASSAYVRKNNAFFDSVGTVGDHEQDIMSSLLKHMPGTSAEVKRYMDRFGEVDPHRFTVIKVGGAIIEEELDDLTRALAFLRRMGLFPVVVHGAGPQLNKEMANAGISPEYIEGMRVTTPRVLEVALPVFHQQNARLVQALEDRGCRARPVPSMVFGAEYLDKEKYGLVGAVSKINTVPIQQAIKAGTLPILPCLGQTASGQTLNINADVAACDLALAIQPLKTIFLGSDGGLKDGDGKTISVISLIDDYEYLLSQPWMKHGARLKLKEIADLLAGLPSSSSVAICKPKDLLRELFTNAGAGTVIHKGVRIRMYENATEARAGSDLTKLVDLLERGFNRKLNKGFVETMFAEGNFKALYIVGDYEGAALIHRGANGVSYMDKFVVGPEIQGSGKGDLLLKRVVEDHPRIYWRSRKTNPINPWYFSIADGSCQAYADSSDIMWTTFWKGLPFSEAQACIDAALATPPSWDQ